MVNLKKREYIVGENIVEQLKAFKHELTRKKWNGFVTWLEDNVQYESVFKGFRIVGTTTQNGDRARAFRIGRKLILNISINLF